MTTSNYRKKKAPDPETVGSKLFSRRIESGIVTRATWQMIAAMPPTLKADYERLTAESLVFYPRKLVARDGAEFDRLVTQLGQKETPWEARIDLETLTKTIVEAIDADYVSLQYPIKDLARSLAERRELARSCSGKGSAEEQAWKLQANTMYGVLTSRRQVVGNAVAANQITTAGRARAWALTLALNGIQVVTDGCTYRLDQIPACSFAKCLELQPDYPLRRAEAGGPIPFLNPVEIPGDEAGFTSWYRAHALGFFEVEGADSEAFFGLHSLEHKQTTVGAAFDALACDGSGSYVKCRKQEGGYQILDQAMRGHGPMSKEVLGPWLVDVYKDDRLTELPPITKDKNLLKIKEARIKARTAIHSGIAEVVLPLGFESHQIKSYQPIRLSAFVCQHPRQFKAIDKQIHRFAEAKGSGLEALALRRGYAGRLQGSLVAIATTIYDEIRKGAKDLSKTLHLTRSTPSADETMRARLDEKVSVAVHGPDCLLKAARL